MANIKNSLADTHLLKLNHELSMVLTSTTSLNRTLDHLLSICCKIDGIDSGAIYLIDRFTGGLRLESYHRLSSEILRKVSLYDFASEETRLVKKGKPIYLPSVNMGSDIFSSSLMVQEGLLFFVSIPVIYDNRIVANMNLYSYTIERITLDVRLVLEAFAMRAGAIIARVNAILALQESEGKYRLLLETMNEGFIILDKSFRITYGNNRFCKMLGYRYNEILGLPVAYFFDETNKKILQKQMRERGRGQKLFFEITWIKADKKTITTRVSPRAMLNKTGIFRGSFAVITDITAIKETSEILKNNERDLIEKTNNLQEVNTALRVFLRKRDEDKLELEEKVLTNVELLINPIISKLKDGNLNLSQKTLILILEANLSNIISPFSRTLSSKHLGLTSSEFDISNFIREGKTTKEIAELMGLSDRTIDSHRFRIRKKLKLNNKKINLRSYLLSLQ